MYQSSEQFLTNVFVIVVNSYYKKSTYLFCLLNNERDQLLMACSLITFENYTYLSNEHQLAAISQLFFLSFFCLAVNLICMLDFNETQEKKKTKPQTIVLNELSISNLLLECYPHYCFVHIWFFFLNGVLSRIISVQRRCSILTTSPDTVI